MLEIYSPSEDSYFLSDTIKKQFKKNKDKSLKILDMGSGTGVQAESCIKLGIDKKNIILADINKDSVSHCKSLGFNAIQSNLFESIPKNNKFDIIIFNPPYLPIDKKEPKDSRLATTGGKHGSEIINRFLKQAKDFLANKGKIILLTSSLTKNINWDGYKKELLAKKKLFFEELYVWEVRIRVNFL